VKTTVDVTEAALLSHVVELAHMLGWACVHFRPALTKHGWRTPVQGDGKGFPDCILVRDRVIFAELKSDTGRLTPEQMAWFNRLTSAGIEAHIWRPADLQQIAEVLR
jgi:hypothetical protein